MAAGFLTDTDSTTTWSQGSFTISKTKSVEILVSFKVFGGSNLCTKFEGRTSPPRFNAIMRNILICLTFHLFGRKYKDGQRSSKHVCFSQTSTVAVNKI